MKFRQTNMPTPASAKAGFSPSSGYRFEHDPRLPSQKQVKRGRRRPDPLAAIWESEIVPMLRLAPGLRPIAIFEEMGRRHPEIDFGVRRTLVEQHPWLPGAVFKAFSQAKDKAVDMLADPSASKATLPFLEERVAQARALMSDDFWPYGFEANRKTLEAFLRHHHAQGLSSRLVKPEELFHPGTLESFKI